MKHVTHRLSARELASLDQKVREELDLYRRAWYKGAYSLSTGSSRYLRKLDRRKARRDRREMLREAMDEVFEAGCLESQSAYDEAQWDSEWQAYQTTIMVEEFWRNELNLPDLYRREHDYDYPDYY